MKIVLAILTITILISCHSESEIVRESGLIDSDLKFKKLAVTWDEAIPLGNGMLGALIWERNNRLRVSLDRADLWDLRPMENLDKPEWRFGWVKEQWEKDTYSRVQEIFDLPYDRNPAPSKIPGGALEFDISSLGEVESANLNLTNAICEIKWSEGVTLQVFINAGKPVGWFRFNGLKDSLLPELIAPAYYHDEETGEENPVTGQDLRRLGYPEGEIRRTDSSITYTQKGWGGFEYQVNVRWKVQKNFVVGCWSINSDFPGWEKQISAENITAEAMKESFAKQFADHQKWWKTFWGMSDISIPDTVLNKQWHLEMYKLGAATGNRAPPISLQAVWTADNGKLPPWKGDFHNDLNTQLSYWPSYSSNHLAQEQGFIDWLIKNRSEFEKYTNQYYQVPGSNVPGVATLTGHPMGGWIQYSFGPTVSAWLGHHFYLHWRYTMDKEFLEKEAYPWIRDVAIFLDELSVTGKDGFKKLPLSSSPEIFDNSSKAWFPEMTNFDLGLVKWTFEKAAELAGELGKTEDQIRWNNILNQWPDFDTDPTTGFTYAKGFPYDQSHRHFSHLLAFHPLGLVDWSNGEKDKQLIKSTIANLDKTGPDWWCGYSWAWLGNIKARAFDGNGAAEALKIFAEDFCLKNSFHVNGDQSGTGKSKMTYRPFTLEGNFAFAAGIQEMLIQSHTGVLQIFPAIPDKWKDVSFNKLRTEGAFLFSASKEEGVVKVVNIVSEKGGELKLMNPFNDENFRCDSPFTLNGGLISITTSPGQLIRIQN